jgi:cobalt/nickel transport system permease protein
LHHLVVEGWSRGASPLHARDARAKLGALLVLLVAISTTPVSSQRVFYGYTLLVAAAAGMSRLPVGALLRRAILLLPFIASFALVTWWSGQPERALGLLEKGFLSGLAALILIATTPVNELLRGLESLAVPRALLLVIQFLYRYLFVISEQAQHMRMAANARGSRFGSAAGAMGVLFAKSWERADAIYRAMLARGFTGTFSTLGPARFAWTDGAFLFTVAALVIGIRLAL